MIYESTIKPSGEGFVADIKYDTGRDKQEYKKAFPDQESANNYVDREQKDALQIRIERYVRNINRLSVIDSKYVNGENKRRSLYKCQKLMNSYDPDRKSLARMYREIISFERDLKNILPPSTHRYYEKLKGDLYEILLFCEGTLL